VNQIFKNIQIFCYAISITPDNDNSFFW